MSAPPTVPPPVIRPPHRPTIEDRSAVPTPPAEGIDGAPAWVSGLLAGAQAALLSFLVVVVPVVTAYVATSGDPAAAELGWGQAAAAGAALWLLGHGAVLVVGGAPVTIVPLGVTALACFIAFASARRTARPTFGAWAAGVGGYLVALGLGALVAGPAGPLGGPGWGWARLAGVGGAVAAVGLAGGLTAARRRRLTGWLPAAVRRGARGGALAVAALVAFAALVTTGWVLAGRAVAGDVVLALDLDTLDGVLLAVGQLALAPNLVAWALAWVAGPGFAVGAGTSFAPDAVVGGPLPALPLLGALPTPAMVAPWVPVVLVGAGLAVGWLLHRWAREAGAWTRIGEVVLATVTAGGGAALVTVLAGGAAGPDRMAQVGGDPVAVGTQVALLVGAGLALTVPLNAAVRRGVARVATGLWGLTAPRPGTGPEIAATSAGRPAAASGTGKGPGSPVVREVPDLPGDDPLDP